MEGGPQSRAPRALQSGGAETSRHNRILFQTQTDSFLATNIYFGPLPPVSHLSFLLMVSGQVTLTSVHLSMALSDRAGDRDTARLANPLGAAPPPILALAEVRVNKNSK